MQQASSAFSTGVPASVAIPQLAGNSRQGFGLIASTSRWASGWVISSTSLGMKGSLYDGDVRSRSTGKERDSESGNDYFGARYYGSVTGRWLSPDVINLTSARLLNPANTLNKYVYGGNNPLKYIDKDGEDITVFYRPPSGAPNDYGHIMLGALNQATGKVAFLDYYPKGGTDSMGSGAGAFNMGDMSDRAAQNAAGQFASLTIRTTPEAAQKVINLIEKLKNGPAPDYSALKNNCTSMCEDVLHDLGLDFGDILPSSYWADLYKNFSPDAQRDPLGTWMYGVPQAPGSEYGNPRNYGMNFSQLLFQIYFNQLQNQPDNSSVTVTQTFCIKGQQGCN